MKKFLSLALSVLMLLSLLAGCGGGSSTDDGAQQNGGSETAETGGKLVVYSALNEDNTIAMAEQFEKDTGIEVEYISLGGGDAVARVQAEMTCTAPWRRLGRCWNTTPPTTMTWMRASMTPIISGRAGTWAF